MLYKARGTFDTRHALPIKSMQPVVCAAGNQLAVLRIHCATGDWSAAEQLVASTQDPAAAFHLARLYEAQDRVPDALRCYSISRRYSHGARLAKRQVQMVWLTLRVEGWQVQRQMVWQALLCGKPCAFLLATGMIVDTPAIIA